MLPFLLLAVCHVVAFGFSPVVADELIMDRNQVGKESCGDFQCSWGSEFADTTDVFYLANLDQSHFEITAGTLWNHFKAQGIESLDRLILFVDVDPTALPDGTLTMEQLELTIVDPASPDQPITDVSLDRGDVSNRIVLRSADGNRNARAKMEFELGYDFMKRFSADSQQKLVLNLQSTEGSLNVASIGIGADMPLLAGKSKTLLLVMFVVFWAGVFYLMYRLTGGGTENAKGVPAVATPTPTSRPTGTQPAARGDAETVRPIPPTEPVKASSSHVTSID